MTYLEKLKDPRWQRKRLEVMGRDNFQCQSCRSKEDTLNVHHKIYKKGREPWEYESNLLVTLCRFCHEEMEIAKARLNQAISGFDPQQLHYLACHAEGMTGAFRVPDMPGVDPIHQPDAAPPDSGWLESFKKMRQGET